MEVSITKLFGGAPAGRNKSGTADFAHYLERYEEQIRYLINWSETAMLQPRYVHLHEADLGLPKDYKVSRYIDSFLGSLDGLITGFATAYFCYSHEEETNRDQSNCRRDAFFAYTWSDGLGVQLVTDEGSASRPRRIPIGELKSLIGKANVFQPYMLTRQNHEHVKCESTTVRTWDEVANLLQAWNGYQFSLYAFEWRSPAPTELDLLLLRQAFLTHILTWNHDLHAVGFLRKELSDNLKDLGKRWNELGRAFNEMRTRIDHMGSGTGSLYHPILSVEDQVWSGDSNTSSLFANNFAHSLNEFNATHIDEFKRRERWLTSGGANAELAEFLRACGVDDIDEAALDQPDTKPGLESWAKGCWFAVKLLTSRILGRKAKLWPDQIALAVCWGMDMDRQDAISIPFVVEFRAASKGMEVAFAETCALGPSTGVWPASAWQFETGLAHWETEGAGGEGYLRAYVRSGLMRNREEPTNAAGEGMLSLPNAEPSSYSQFLRNLARFVTAFRESKPNRGDAAIVTKIRCVTDVTREEKMRLRTAVHIAFEGHLSGDFYKGGGGLLSQHFNRILEHFGQAGPIECGEPLNTGGVYRLAPSGSEIVIVLTSDEG